MSFWLLYLITRTGEIQGFCAGVGMIGFIVSCVAYGVSVCLLSQKSKYSEDEKAFGESIHPYSVKGIRFFLIPLFFAAAMPSTDDWKLIIGGYYVSNIQGIEQLPPDIIAATHNFLEKYGQDDKKKDSTKDDGKRT